MPMLKNSNWQNAMNSLYDFFDIIAAIANFSPKPKPETTDDEEIEMVRKLPGMENFLKDKK